MNEKDANLLKKLYTKVIKKYINADPDDDTNINNFRNEFILFDRKYGYKEVENNGVMDIQSELRDINLKFRLTPFHIWVHGKDDISNEELQTAEYLCYLNLLLLGDDKFLERI